MNGGGTWEGTADSAEDRAQVGDAGGRKAGNKGRSDLFRSTSVDKAKAQALRFLNYKQRSRAELSAKLLDRGHAPDDVSIALDELHSAGVQSDTAYVEMFARYKWRTSKWAPARIASALGLKGIARADINDGLSAVFGDEGEVRVSDTGNNNDGGVEDGDWTGFGEVVTDEDRGSELLQSARAQWRRSAGLSITSRRRRLAMWLERRGHRFHVIRSILEILEREDDTETNHS